MLPTSCPKPAKREKQARKPVKRGGRIKPKKREAAEAWRIYGPTGRAEFVNTLPCASCGLTAGRLVMMANAHIENGGMGRKAAYLRIIPLCTTADKSGCHDLQHQHGWGELPRLAHPEERLMAANATEAAWQAFLNSAVSPEREPSNG